MADLPALLTVEEAGRLLRIGRTKAYAMAKEWRETDGASGLPVYDLGDVLRVPLAKLEAMTGAEFSDVGGPASVRSEEAGPSPTPVESRATSPSSNAPPAVPARTKSASARRARAGNDQLELFEQTGPTD